MATSISSERSREVVLPSTISYSDAIDARAQKTDWCSHFFQYPLQVIGKILRNALYLPLYKEKVDLVDANDQRLAERVSYALQNSEVLGSEEVMAIRRCFSMRDIPVHLRGPVVRTFIIRVFESRMPIGERKLRVMLFSFNGNTEHKGEAPSSIKRWDPSNIQEVSTSPLSVLRAFQELGVRVHSLVTHSLGNVIFHGLKHLPAESNVANIIPPTLVINRGLTSTQKVANRLFSYPWNSILRSVGQLCGWDADPENGLLGFLDGNPRKVVIIEAHEDHYFSGKGAFEPDIHKKIARLGASVFRALFWPFPFHSRSHHDVTLDHLRNNSLTQVHANTMSFTLHEDEPMSSALARNIFFEEGDEWHTCFCVAGSDATREIGTVKEALPLLAAFIKEGGRREQVDPARRNAI